MDYYSSYITKLIEEFARLPGIGNKSAQRLAFHIMNQPEEQVRHFTDTILQEILLHEVLPKPTCHRFLTPMQ